MHTFMASVVNQTTVGKDLTRFGVILYSDTPKSSFTLNEIYSKGKVLEALQQLVQPGGGTHTGAALAYSLPYFNAEHGGRKEMPQILMVITDGEAQDSDRLKAESDALRQNGITVISIGVQDAKRDQLETMAGGDTSKVFFVDNFKDLETLYQNISSVICNSTKRGKSVPKGIIMLPLVVFESVQFYLYSTRAQQLPQAALYIILYYCHDPGSYGGPQEPRASK